MCQGYFLLLLLLALQKQFACIKVSKVVRTVGVEHGMLLYTDDVLLYMKQPQLPGPALEVICNYINVSEYKITLHVCFGMFHEMSENETFNSSAI